MFRSDMSDDGVFTSEGLSTLVDTEMAWGGMN